MLCLHPDEVVRQEIALYKVARSRNVERLVREHNVRILEIDAEYIVVEKTGHKAEYTGASSTCSNLRRAAVRPLAERYAIRQVAPGNC